MKSAWLLWHACLALANVEKTIFTAPADLRMTTSSALLSNLCLPSLKPDSLDTRQHRISLPVSFAVEGARVRGNSSWYLLERLRAGQRYEARVCWSATQPTDFQLTTYGISEVFDNPDLLQDLSAYSSSRQSGQCPEQQQQPQTTQSVVFLNIQAAADFYSSDTKRMQNPPDVLVDIILDPYVLNIIPQSLMRTGAFILVLLPVSYLISNLAWRIISRLAAVKDKVS